MQDMSDRLPEQRNPLPPPIVPVQNTSLATSDLWEPSPRPPAECSPDPVTEGKAILAEAAERYGPVKVFALFSCGRESLCSAHLASTTPPFNSCVHINTGIGIEQTREFVRATCAKHGWPLLEYHSPVSYEEIVLRWGFPGPAGHTLVYNRLKERCL